MRDVRRKEVRVLSSHRVVLAVENGLRSIAFPAISTGVFGYNNLNACNDVLSEVRKFLDEGKGDSLERIVFCNFLQKDQDIYFRNVS